MTTKTDPTPKICLIWIVILVIESNDVSLFLKCLATVAVIFAAIIPMAASYLGVRTDE